MMFKKLLCWVLIVQHFNIYVVHAGAGDIKILYEASNDIKSSTPSFKLSISKEVSENKHSKVLTALFETDAHHSRFLSRKFVPNKFDFGLVKVTPSEKGIHLSSANPEHRFSIHLKPDGTILLQEMDLEAVLNIETFGNIFIKNIIKAKKLALAGSRILNYTPITVDELSLCGEVVNTCEGQINIRKSVQLQGGHFTNQGRIQGSDGAIFYCNGNNFFNQDVNHKKFDRFEDNTTFGTYVTWNGLFSFKDVGVFQNEASVLPLDDTGDFSLFIHANTLINRGALTSCYLNVNCEKDLLNYGRIQSHLLGIFSTGDSFFNKSKGRVKGDVLTIYARNNLINKHLIKATELSVVADYFKNLDKIFIQDQGNIIERPGGKGLVNAANASIHSAGGLKVIGHYLENQIRNGKKGTIESNDLVMTLDQVTNHGDITAHRICELYIEESTNNPTGLWHLSRDGKLVAHQCTNRKAMAGDAIQLDVHDFRNFKSISASDYLTIQLTSRFANEAEALVFAVNELDLQGENASLKNKGTFASKNTLNIHSQDVENEGHILSTNSLSIDTIQSEFPEDPEREDFKNTAGLVHSDTVAIRTRKGSNIGLINDSISADPGLLQGIIARKDLHLTTTQEFSNNGHLVGGKTALFDGAGMLKNDGSINKTNAILFQVPKVQNSGIVNAYESLEFTHLVEGLANSGLILSQGSLHISECSDLSNDGIVEGRQGDVSIETNILDNTGIINALGGGLQLTVNQGKNDNRIFSADSLSLGIEELFENNATIEGNGEVSLTGKEFINNRILKGNELVTDLQSFTNGGGVSFDNTRLHFDTFANTNTFVGITSVSLDGNQLLNEGNIASGGKVDCQVNSVDNAGLISGKEGLRIVSPQAITQQPTGILQSEAAAISLEAPEFQLEGELRSPRVEIQSTGPHPFVSNHVDLKIAESFTLNAYNGWDLQGVAQTFAHDLVYTGTITNPAPLYIKGDFTWNCPDDLETYFDIIVEGKLTLIINGSWRNFANIQGHGGLELSSSYYQNHGTVYAADNTRFELSQGLDNYGQIEIRDACDIDIAAGNFTNHPDAAFYQRSLDGQDPFHLNVSGKIDNHNALLFVEGAFHSQSQQFLNRSIAPDIEYIPGSNIQPSMVRQLGVLDQLGMRGMLRMVGRLRRINQPALGSSQKKPASREYPVFRKDGGKGALFHANSAFITATELRNHGSTMTAAQGFSFNGARIHNTTQYFCERGIQYTYAKRQIEVPKKGKKKYKYAGPRKTEVGHEWQYYYINTPYEDALNAFVARIYSHGPLSLSALVSGTGEINGSYVAITGGGLVNIQRHDLTHVLAPIPSYIPLTDFYAHDSLLESGLWRVDQDQETSFQIIPTTPTRLPSQQTLIDQLYEGTEDRGSHESLIRSSLFWQPNMQDFAPLFATLTPEDLLQVPPRIALLTNGMIEDGARMHHHPSVLADLVIKTFMETLGFSSLSPRLTNPLLLTRVLEEQGYLTAVKCHGESPAETPADWSMLSLTEQLHQQTREHVTLDDVESFADPAIVYKVWEDFGEKVFSAMVVFPRFLRDAFKLVSGRILAEYLLIDTKFIVNQGGDLGGTHTLAIKTAENLINDKGTVKGGELLTAKVGKTLSNLSGLYEGGTVELQAHDVYSNTAVKREITDTGYRELLDDIATFRSTTGDLGLTAESGIHGIATAFDSKKDLDVSAGSGGLLFDAQQTEIDYTYHTHDTSVHRHTVTNHKTTFNSDQSLHLNTTGNAVYRGVDARAKEEISRNVGGVSLDLQVTDIETQEITRREKKKRVLGSKKSVIHIETSEHTGKGNQWSGESFQSVSQDDTRLQGVTVGSKPHKAKISSKKKVILDGLRSSSSYSYEKKSKSMLWQSSVQEGYQHEIITLPALPYGVDIGGQDGIQVEIPVQEHYDKDKLTRKESLASALDRLENTPGTEWIRTLRNQEGIQWDAVEESHKHWRYKTQGLTAIAATFLSLAVAIATAGVGSCALMTGMNGALSTSLGTLGAQAVTSAATAGIQVLASQASISLINNQGNIGKTLKDLGKSANLKSLAASMATAGTMQYIGANGWLNLPNDPKQMTWTNHITKGLSHSVVSSGMSSLIQGHDFDIKETVTKGIIQGLATYGASRIGDGYTKDKNGHRDLNYWQHKALHGILGGIQGALKGDASAGALGALVAEVVGEATAEDAKAIAQRLGARAVAEDVAIDSDTFEDWVQAEARDSVDWGKVAAVVAAGLAHRNADIALDTATVALENNLLPTLIYGVMVAARVLGPALVATNAVLTTVDVIEGVEEDGIEGGLQVIREDTALAMTTFGMAKPVKVGKKGVEKVTNLVKKTGKSNAVKGSKLSEEQPWNIRPGQEWKEKIVGTGQTTKTDGHSFRSRREAIVVAKQEKVVEVTLDRGVNRMLPEGLKIKPNRRPDVTYKTNDGRIHQIEVPSKSDSPEKLIERMRDTRTRLPAEMRGDFDIKLITKPKK